jgi:hypothetical protein
MAIVWSTELLRLSLFASEPVQASDADWTAITGQAESETRQTHAGGGRSYIGMHRDTQWTIGSFGQRLDIMQSAYPPARPQETKAPTIGDWEQVREAFVRDTERWLATTRFRVVRIAFSCVLLIETKDRLEAYELLKMLLKSVQVDPEGMRELFFRVNWPLKSVAVPGLQLNRITNWSSLRLQNVLLQVAGSSTSVYLARPH